LLDSGKILPTSNMLSETIFEGIWSAPNFHEKSNDTTITTWPVYGWDYDVLIGGLYPGLLPEWDYNLRAYTLELAFPVTIANQVLQRVRGLFDAQLAKGITMTSTYRSGINIKFGRAYNDLLGQVWANTTDGTDWTKGAIMFDFPSYRPTWGDNLRFNEPFCKFSAFTVAFFVCILRLTDHNLSSTLINEFPCRPHWTKNSRDVLAQSVKNLDPGVSDLELR
jgi:hypothetical protein